MQMDYIYKFIEALTYLIYTVIVVITVLLHHIHCIYFPRINKEDFDQFCSDIQVREMRQKLNNAAIALC